FICRSFYHFLPNQIHVLVERSVAETITKGGIMLPEKSQGKVLQAMVVAAGSGSKGKGGQIQPVSIKVGDKSFPRIWRHQSSSRQPGLFLIYSGHILGKYVD
uniref:Chaperonin 10 n=1 Tax=Bos indicus x Bos taurus TaxID=30522 RepID=A0A4W2EDB7_BOBOX